MPILLFLIFVAVPLVEIAVFIYVGDIIGIAATVGLVIITAFIGTALLRYQGLSVLSRAQNAVQEGRIPVDSVIDGLFLLIAGAFLLTPGLITDSAGFLLFVPFLRRRLAHWIFQRLIKSEHVKFSIFGTPPVSGPGSSDGSSPEKNGPIIDGDYRSVDDDDYSESGYEPDQSSRSPDRNSPWRQ